MHTLKKIKNTVECTGWPVERATVLFSRSAPAFSSQSVSCYIIYYVSERFFPNHSYLYLSSAWFNFSKQKHSKTSSMKNAQYWQNYSFLKRSKLRFKRFEQNRNDFLENMGLLRIFIKQNFGYHYTHPYCFWSWNAKHHLSGYRVFK